MRLDFKKGLSFVLALVMMVSALTMVNVVSVSAATETLDFGSSTVKDKLDADKNDSVDNKENSFADVPGLTNFYVHVNDTDRIIKDGYLQFKSNSDYINVVANAKDTIKIEAKTTSTQSNKRYIKIEGTEKGGGTAKNASDSNQDYLTTTSTQYTYTVDKDDTYKISSNASGGDVQVYTVTLETGEAAQKTKWSIVKDDYYNSLDLKGDLSVIADRDGESTILSYTGADDYTINAENRVLRPGDPGVEVDSSVQEEEVTGYKFTLSADNLSRYLIKNVKVSNTAVSIEGGANRILHVQCKTHKTVMSIMLDESEPAKAKGMLITNASGGYNVTDTVELPLHDDTFVLSIPGGTIDGQKEKEVTINSDSPSITGKFEGTALKEISDKTGQIMLNDLKVTSEARAERVYAGTVFGDGYFFAVGTGYDSNVYALSTPSESGDLWENQMIAYVIRGVNNEDGGLGFTLASGSDAEGTTYNLDLWVTAVNDISLPNTDEHTTIGIKEIDKSSYSIIGSPVESKIVPVKGEEAIDESDWEKITFTDLKPGSTYSVYNPGGESQSNLRIFAAQFTKKGAETPAGEYWSPDNKTDILGEALSKISSFSSMSNSKTGSFSEPIFKVAGSEGETTGEIKNQKYLKYDSNTASTTPITAKYDGKLRLYITRGADADDTAQIKINGTAKYNDTICGMNTPNIDAIEIKDVKAGNTITFSGTVCIFRAELIPDGPAIAQITGTVSSVKEFSYVNHDNYEQLAVNSGPDYKYVENVTPTTKKITEQLKTYTITAKNSKGEAVDSSKISVDASGKYTIGDGKESLPDETYTITINGKEQPTKVIVKGNSVTQNYELTEPTYTVRFVTNIKDYSSDGKISIKTEDGSKELFVLEDKTYHNKNDGNNYNLDTVNSAASVTHTVKMPAGNYQYSYGGTVYKLSNTDDDSAGATTLDFEVTKAATQRQRLYLRPDKNSITSNTDIQGSITNATSDIASTYVSSGKYTFEALTSSDTSTKDITINFTSEEDGVYSGTGKEHGMAAYGVYGSDSGTDYAGIDVKHGAVVFQLDRPFLAKIETSLKSCVLYCLDEGAANEINGIQTIISTDSSYGAKTVSLAPGKYALVSTTSAESGDKPARLRSITFISGSPFTVDAADVSEYTDNTAADINNARMIIGTYDSSNDNSFVGTSNADSYDKFAILISRTKDALKVDAIDNIDKAEKYKGPTSENLAEERKSTAEYMPDLYSMVVTNSSYPVMLDATDTVFETIIGSDGSAIKPKDESGNKKYFATIVNNLGTGEYFVAGAAKMKGEDLWLVQDYDEIRSFNVG